MAAVCRRSRGTPRRWVSPGFSKPSFGFGDAPQSYRSADRRGTSPSRMMENTHDADDAKLREEIDAELDKISISSLEKDDVGSDSGSETQSDSDTDLDELPESVLHCINIIKNKNIAAEELILQDLEDTDILSYSYRSVSDNPVHLRVELSTGCQENPQQLMKILSEIEKEEFLRSKTRASSDSAPEPGPHDLPLEEQVFPDDTDINFEYCEVEERCRQSFEAWQDKQKELEGQEREALKAQKDREEKQFQEEEEKRHCWLKQFEIEKKKLENFQKQEQDKMNNELQKEEKMWEEKFKQHEEFIKNLHLQMEQERTRFKELQEKETKRLLTLQHNAAIKIQAHYKALVAYQKYNPIIKEQVENKKKKAQEWKEKEAEIRQRDEEKRNKLEEEQRIEEEKKKQRQEALEKRKKEYEEKKNILRLKREQIVFKEKLRIREGASKQLTSEPLKKGEDNIKLLTIENTSENESDIAEKLVDEKPENQENISLWLVTDTRKSVDRQLIVKAPLQEQLKECISKPPILAELKEEEINENLAQEQYSNKLISLKRKHETINKQPELQSPDLEDVKEQFKLQELKSQIQKEGKLKHVIVHNVELKEEEINENLAQEQYSNKLISLKRKHENINKQPELQSLDLEDVKEQFKLQELKSQIQKEGKLKQVIVQNVEQETHITTLEHNEETNEANNSKAQKITKDNQQKKVQEIEKEKIPQQNAPLCEESISMISLKQKLPPLELENSAVVGDVVLQEEDIDLKSDKMEESSKGSALNSDTAVVNTSDTIINIEGTINKQDHILDRQALSETASGYGAKSFLVSKETNSVKSEIKELPEDCYENRPESEGSMTCREPEQTLLSSIEEKRLAWVKSFKPWFEIFLKHQQKKIVKRRRSVKCLVDNLPPLNELEILRRGPWNALWQVTTVTFQDLPGCSLSTLSECINLQYLSLQRCKLTSLHSLSNCKNLKYIDVQENLIETISCENLENLCILLLNKNQLSSLHGLDGCTNIQNLELSHNKITRIGGLESLKSLQQLILDHNQLISTKGLSDTPTIIYLDCSHNHLTEVQGIANCGLLQVLKLQGNYLSELPSLENHVLLRELHLDDNSISTVAAFSSYWLPLLQNLTISQNSLTEIIPLFHFVSLEKLDLSNNCLSDLTSVLRWFDACISLRELSLIGNPLLQEINWRHSLLKVLPDLKILNGEILNSYSESHTEEQHQLEPRSFLALYQSQIREFNLLTENCITGKGNVSSLDGAEKLSYYFKKLMVLSNEYRDAHEHLDLSMERNGLEAQQNHLVPTQTDHLLQNTVLNSCADEHKPDSSTISKKCINAGSSYSPLTNSSTCNSMEGRNQEKVADQRKEDTQASNMATKSIPVTKTVVTTSLLRNCQNVQHNENIMAAMIIQAFWRGYIVHKQTGFSRELQTVAAAHLTSQPNSGLQSQTILKEKETRHIVNIQEQREKAAILIQAVWKGFLLRKKLTTALEAIRYEESEEEYEEIDLEDFTFDEAALEKEWLASDSTRFPSQTQLLPNQLHWPKYSGTLEGDDTLSNLPSHPAQAWLCKEKENMFSPEHAQLNSRSESKISLQIPESKTSRSLLKSKKEEKISEEWGFKAISTAQQMLKRAQKMKSKKLKEKKDPAVRLALFKSNDSKLSVTKAPKKAQPRRDKYFEGKEELFCKDATANEGLERRREYTYQWLHTQVGVHETASSRNIKCNHFLPELDPDVLNGGRVQLVARLASREERDLDLFSMTSGSALSVNREKKNQAHRHSAGSSSGSIKGIFAPMITNAKPSKKERISFRDNPVQLSGGWGSGKKKEKTSK